MKLIHITRKHGVQVISDPYEHPDGFAQVLLTNNPFSEQRGFGFITVEDFNKNYEIKKPQKNEGGPIKQSKGIETGFDTGTDNGAGNVDPVGTGEPKERINSGVEKRTRNRKPKS